MNKLTWKLGVGLIAVIGICGIGLARWPIASSQDAAAWAQAISTGAAVVVALFVAGWQEHKARAAEALRIATAAADRTETAFQLSAYVEAVGKKVLEHCQHAHNPDRTFLTNAAGELEAIGAAFGKYSPSDFGSYEQLRPLVSVMAVRSALEAHLQRGLSRMDSLPVGLEIARAFETVIQSVAADVQRLQKSSNLARKAAGPPYPG